MGEIVIVGLGIKHAKELTLRGLSELKSCRVVLIHAPRVAEIESDLNFLGLSNIRFISDTYHNGAKDQDNYDRALELVYKEAAHSEKIGLLVTGHPRIGVSIVQSINEKSKAEGFKMKVIEGISSFDTMINDLEIDPLERGSVMVDANRLILFDIAVPPDLNLFIYHPSSTGNSRTDFLEPQKNNRINMLASKLLKTYSPEKMVAIVTSSTDHSPADITWSSISELEKSMTAAKFWSTLFVPAEMPRSINNNFLTLIRNTGKWAENE